MCFSAAASSENDHGSMNLASKTAPVRSTIPSRVAAIHGITWCRAASLDILDDMPAVKFVPSPVEVFGHRPKLDDEVIRQVLWLGLATLLPPQP
jgi:hypothetical protein